MVGGSPKGGSRAGYKDQLERLLDFLFFFVACTETMMLPREVIDALWTEVVSHASTGAECDAVLHFLMRLAIRNDPPTPPGAAAAGGAHLGLVLSPPVRPPRTGPDHERDPIMNGTRS